MKKLLRNKNLKRTKTDRFIPLLFVCLGLSLYTSSYAQESHGGRGISQSSEVNQEDDDSPFFATLVLSNKYLFRGLEEVKSPVIIPEVGYDFKGITVYAAGIYAFDGDYQEVDFGIQYSYKDYFTIGLCDYYTTSDFGEFDQYFHFNNHTTTHCVDAYAKITPFKFPLWLMVGTFIYGCDKDYDGKQAYSSYAELGYEFSIKENHSLSLLAGVSLNKGMYTDYEGGFNLVNVEVRYDTSFKFGNFRLPVRASYVVNPYTEKPYVIISLFFNSF